MTTTGPTGMPPDDRDSPVTAAAPRPTVAAATLPALLARRLRADGASPLLTFYDDETGERTELSAVTFANWVAKTANLLVDGLGLAPGDRASLALPAHWQSLVVAAGCWEAGLSVTFAGPAEVRFLVEGDSEPAGPAAGEAVVLSLRPLGAGLRMADPLRTDYATEVRIHGDRFAGPGPAPADPALDERTHAALCAEPGAGGRILLAPDGDPRLDEATLLAAYVRPLVGGGSVVLCRHADPARLTRRAHDERATPASS